MIVFYSLPVNAPLRITSRYGPRNTGIKGASTFHKGVDMGRNLNAPNSPTNILAVAPGKICRNYWNDTRGWVVVVEHTGGEFKTLSQHMAKQCPLPVGTEVAAGQQIGVLGASSKTIQDMQAHLHFELIVSDGNIDPEPYLRNIRALPVQKEVDDMTEEEVKTLLKGEDTVADTWAQVPWSQAKQLGLTDGTRPLGFATREEVAAMIVNALKRAGVN